MQLFILFIAILGLITLLFGTCNLHTFSVKSDHRLSCFALFYFFYLASQKQNIILLFTGQIHKTES